MSYQHVDLVLSNSGLRGPARFVLSVLASYMDDEGKCWPSFDTLAKKCNVCRSQIAVAVKRVVESGEVELLRAGGGNAPNLYRLTENWSNASLESHTRPATRTRLENHTRLEIQMPTRPVLHVDPSGFPDTNHQEPPVEPPSVENPSRVEPETHTDPIVMQFPLKAGGEWALTSSKIAEYRQTFPTLDVLKEVRAARQWAIDKPAKRKTARGMPAFLSGWLKRADDAPHEPAPELPEYGEVANVFLARYMNSLSNEEFYASEYYITDPSKTLRFEPDKLPAKWRREWDAIVAAGQFTVKQSRAA